MASDSIVPIVESNVTCIDQYYEYDTNSTISFKHLLYRYVYRYMLQEIQIKTWFKTINL